MYNPNAGNNSKLADEGFLLNNGFSVSQVHLLLNSQNSREIVNKFKTTAFLLQEFNRRDLVELVIYSQPLTILQDIERYYPDLKSLGFKSRQVFRLAARLNGDENLYAIRCYARALIEVGFSPKNIAEVVATDNGVINIGFLKREYLKLRDILKLSNEQIIVILIDVENPSIRLTELLTDNFLSQISPSSSSNDIVDFVKQVQHLNKSILELIHDLHQLAGHYILDLKIINEFFFLAYKYYQTFLQAVRRVHEDRGLLSNVELPLALPAEFFEIPAEYMLPGNNYANEDIAGQLEELAKQTASPPIIFSENLCESELWALNDASCEEELGTSSKSLFKPDKRNS